MDDGELDFSDQDMFSSLAAGDSNMESFLDEILKSTHTCTHTHTCNPPGPDKTHTHTCFHTHTQLFASPSGGDEAAQAKSPAAANGGGKKKRPLGNREAVRKYREKKKAHAAYLEEQVSQLKALNQQLVRRLQGQAALEAEVVRLRGLLAHFRSKIDGELGPFPCSKRQQQQQQQQQQVASASPNVAGRLVLDCSQALSGGFYLNAVTVPCDADVPCFHHDESNASQQLEPQHQQQEQACDFVSEEACAAAP